MTLGCILVFIFSFGVVQCAQGPDGELPAVEKGVPLTGAKTSVVAIANPASVYCEENGGRLEIRDTDAGQVGYCIFPDNSECEEWAYFRGKCLPGVAGSQTQAVIDYVPIPPEDCKILSNLISESIASPLVMEEAPFLDNLTGKSGKGCKISVTGSGDSLGDMGTIFKKLQAMMAADGWQEDAQYSMTGVTVTSAGFRKGKGLCLVNIAWQAAKGLSCGEQSTGDCGISPAQQVVTVVLNCATQQ